MLGWGKSPWVLFALLGFMAICCISCSTRLTKPGSEIRIVTANQKERCRSVGIVTGSCSWGWSTAHDMENAMNELRNRAARLGANSIFILTGGSDAFSSTVSAEALRCD